MTAALVSILIPTYNRAGLISEAIRSALAQTYTTIEIVVVDNASTDTTWHEIQEVARYDTRVRAFRNEKNIGPVRNWIECVRHAQGTYSKILWSDDLIAPTFLERCIPHMESGDVGFVYTATRIFKNQQDLIDGPVHYDNLPTGRYPTQLFIEGVLLGAPFPYSPGCAVFQTCDLVKNLWTQVPNSIKSDFSQHAIGNDLLLFLLTANQHAEFSVINEPLSYFRDHPNSISTSSGEGRLVLHYDIVRAYFSQNHVTDRKLAARINSMLWIHLRRFNGHEHGINKIRDFYPEENENYFSISFFIEKLINKIVRSLK